MRNSRGAWYRKGLGKVFLRKRYLNWELWKWVKCQLGKKVKETPDSKSLIQGSAWAVLGEEKRNIKYSGENSMRGPWRNRGWNLQGPVGSLIVIKNMGLYPKNCPLGKWALTWSNLYVLRKSWLLCRKWTEGEQIGENLLNNIQVSQLIIHWYCILYCNLLGCCKFALVPPCGNWWGWTGGSLSSDFPTNELRNWSSEGSGQFPGFWMASCCDFSVTQESAFSVCAVRWQRSRVLL